MSGSHILLKSYNTGTDRIGLWAIMQWTVLPSLSLCVCTEYSVVCVTATVCANFFNSISNLSENLPSLCEKFHSRKEGKMRAKYCLLYLPTSAIKCCQENDLFQCFTLKLFTCILLPAKLFCLVEQMLESVYFGVLAHDSFCLVYASVVESNFCRCFDKCSDTFLLFSVNLRVCKHLIR